MPRPQTEPLGLQPAYTYVLLGLHSILKWLLVVVVVC